MLLRVCKSLETWATEVREDGPNSEDYETLQYVLCGLGEWIEKRGIEIWCKAAKVYVWSLLELDLSRWSSKKLKKLGRQIQDVVQEPRDKDERTEKLAEDIGGKIVEVMSAFVELAEADSEVLVCAILRAKGEMTERVVWNVPDYSQPVRSSGWRLEEYVAPEVTTLKQNSSRQPTGRRFLTRRR